MKIEKELLSEKDLAALGTRSEQSWRNDRWSGNNLIPYIKIGKNVRYRKSDVLAFFEKNTFPASK